VSGAIDKVKTSLETILGRIQIMKDKIRWKHIGNSTDWKELANFLARVLLGKTVIYLK
jgi:hypothetical protein